MFMVFAFFVACLLLVAFAIWGEKVMGRDDAKFLAVVLASYLTAFIVGVAVLVLGVVALAVVLTSLL